ncbi:MAG: MATE family efflux transporter [Lachnospiraceae bacterium]|nr:MATE family efflux transporter [Lachnospiraceae bacterium]
MENSAKKTGGFDMLSGSIADKILIFALPLAATGILQQLFNAADVAVVGRFVGSGAMAAVGANGPLTSLIISLFIGLSIGSNVVIAKYTGERNAKAVNITVHTSLLVSFLMGVVLAVVFQVLARPILSLMSIPDSVFRMAELYFRVYMAGMPVILLYNFASAIFRGRGNTRTPLICLALSGIVNVGLNVFFVVALHMTVEGVALATVLSNLISSILLLVFLSKEEEAIRFRFRSLRIDRKILRQIVRIGLPAGFQGVVFSVSNIVLQAAVNKLGETVMAGSSAALNIEIFAYFLLNAFGTACTTFISANYGAGKPDRCRKILVISLIQDLICTVVMAAVLLLFARQLLSIFNGEPAVIAIGVTRMKIILAFEAVNVLIEIFSGWMRGFGISFLPSMVCMIGICGVRITYAYTVFAHNPTFDTLMVAYPLSWAVTAAVMVIMAVVVRRKSLAGFFAKHEEADA